jgi:CelD/BcsL family acetyltransferase involved in cellulose biosynthesis
LADSASASPFQSREWHQTWRRHLAPTGKSQLFAAYEGDDLVGLWPMWLRQGAWRVLRSAGAGPSDYLHPLIRNGYEETVSQTFFEAVSEFHGADLIDLHQLRSDKPIAQGRSEGLVQATCLVADLPETFDTFLGTLSKSLRYDARRLTRDENLTFDWATSESLTSDLAILFDLHKSRWKSRGLPGAFLGRQMAFQQDWTQQALAKGWLRLGVLRESGTPIGAIYAMALGQTTYFYQCGFDPERSKISPGTLVVAASIERAIGEGHRAYDFLRGDEPYKRRWKPSHTHETFRFMMRGKSLRGNVGLGWNKFAFQVEARLRERFEGKGLRG